MDGCKDTDFESVPCELCSMRCTKYGSVSLLTWICYIIMWIQSTVNVWHLCFDLVNSCSWHFSLLKERRESDDWKLEAEPAADHWGDVRLIEMVQWVGYLKDFARSLDWWCLGVCLIWLNWPFKVTRSIRTSQNNIATRVNITTSLFDCGKSKLSSPQLTVSLCPIHTPIPVTILNTEGF